MKQNPLEWLSEALLTLTTIPIILMMGHITVDVLLKFLFNTHIQGTLEVVSYYYMIAVVLMPLAFVELTRQSIAVDMFFLMFPKWLQYATTHVVLLISAATYGGLAAVTWPDALHALRIRESMMGSANIAIWPARFLLPIALSLTALVCLLLIYKILTDDDAARKIVEAHDPTELGVE